MTPAPEMAPQLATSSPEQETPGIDARGFSIFICKRGTYSKHVELVELTDPVTGLPFPLVPVDGGLPLNNGYLANWHHGFHPKPHTVLVNTIGGRAMRSTQIQLVVAEQHNNGSGAYHNFNVGPFIHRKSGHQLGACIAAAAGYRHDRGIATHADELWVHQLTEQQQRHLTVVAEPEPFEPWHAALYGRFYGLSTYEQAEDALLAQKRRQAALHYRNMTYGYEPIRHFITSTMFGQDLSNVSKKVRKRFLHRGDSEKGLQLMAVAAEEIASSTITYNGQTLRGLYASLREAGRINPAMPPNVAELLKHKLGNLDSRRQLVPVFHMYLSRREEEAG